MADSLRREERVAAGLKKLKKFQQKREAKLKRDPTPVKTVASKPIESPVKTLKEPKVASNTVSTIPSNSLMNNSPSHDNSISASSPSLNDSASIETNQAQNSLNTEPITKSKSDLDIASAKELSSTESLLQISQQLNGLISESYAFVNGTLEEEDQTSMEENQSLERRNQELASKVDCLRQSNDHLQFQLQEAKSKIARSKREFEQERQLLQEKSRKEQVALNDQLQVHIQTIGILVAEKTELQSSLSLSQQTAKQKAGEVEELQGRLRGSRQRANDLERELNGLNIAHQQLEKETKQTTKEIERLKLENYKLNKSVEEAKQQCSEFVEKLNKKISECQKLENEVTDVKSKLSMAELYAEQMARGNSTEKCSQVEEFHLQKLELEKSVSLHQETIQKLTDERDKMSQQFQMFIQQLSQQVTSLRDELKQMSEEKDAMTKEKNALQEKLDAALQVPTNSQNSDQYDVQLKTLEQKITSLAEDLSSQVSDNAQLSKLLVENETRINELTNNILRYQEQEGDQTKLLETIQSEKVAASRAVSQNRELKKQLAELQNGFISMSNDKLHLTEKLHGEQHITKELGERLSQQEDELRELKEQLASKDVQLNSLEKSNTKGMYQQSQIVDRMRHYEAQGHLAEMLQQELNQAKEKLSVLVNQNTELRMALATQAEITVSSDSSKDEKDSSKRNNLVASLSASVRQLEMERDQMMKQLDEQKAHHRKLEEQMTLKGNQSFDGAGDDGTIISKEEYEILRSAMEKLEDKFKKTMTEIADLSDEKQRLEHLVLQLQGETETIGDYIALYQIQRGLMRKRASEKDDYIAQLAKDREDLKTKLGELQDLVMRLLDERKLYQSQGIMALDGTSDVIDANNVGIDNQVNDNPNALSTSNTIVHDMLQVNGNETMKTETTAKKIMELLSEIGTTNLVEKPMLDNFHPCAVCSGRLITV